jgi:hypothetical protein
MHSADIRRGRWSQCWHWHQISDDLLHLARFASVIVVSFAFIMRQRIARQGVAGNPPESPSVPEPAGG